MPDAAAVEVVKKQPKWADEPIIDKSWLAAGANLAGRGKSPLDLLLSESGLMAPDQDQETQRDMIRTLVERGLVPEMVKRLIKEFFLASNESLLWSGWITKMIEDGNYLRPSVMKEWGEYRQRLVTGQLALAKFLIEELRESEKLTGKKKKKSPVRSYIPSEPNPIADRIANGQNPLVKGEDSVVALMNRLNHVEEKNHASNFADPAFTP